MELEVWPSDFLLPSIDCRSLQFLVCARMCAAPIRIIKDSPQPWTSPSGTLPVFRHGPSTAYTTFHKFANYLRKQIPELTLDGHLTDAERSEAKALESLLHEKLHPAYLHTVWVDLPNYNVVTNRWYTRRLPAFYGMFYSNKQRRHAISYVRECVPGDLVTDEDIRLAVTKQALHCINLLSAKLGDKKYFFGDKPTSLDALTFGYLAPLLKLPLPNDRIQLHLRQCANLVRFVDAVIAVYLPLTNEESTQQREDLKDWEERRERAQAEMKPPEPPQDASGEPHEFSNRDKVLFGISAAIVTLIFALHFGILQFEIREVSPGSSKKRERD